MWSSLAVLRIRSTKPSKWFNLRLLYRKWRVFSEQPCSVHVVHTADVQFKLSCQLYIHLPVPHYLYGKTNIYSVLTALKAGCQQQPSSGKLIGLDGSLFSSIPVNITSPTTPSAATVSSNNPDGLSIGAKVGIGIGAILLILIIASVIFICIKKRRVRHLSSSYHPRFGAVEISAPTKGAFTSPSFLPVTDTIPFVLRRQQSQQSSDDSFDLEKLAKKLSRPVSNVTSFSSGTTTRDSSPNIKTCAFDRSVTQPPVHQAYIPGAYADHAISPATSISNNPWMVHSSTRPTTRQSLNTITQPAPTLSRETSIKTHVSNLQGRNRSQSPPSATSLGRQQSLRIPAYACLPPVEGIKEQSPDSAHSVEQWPGQMWDHIETHGSNMEKERQEIFANCFSDG